MIWLPKKPHLWIPRALGIRRELGFGWYPCCRESLPCIGCNDNLDWTVVITGWANEDESCDCTEVNDTFALIPYPDEDGPYLEDEYWDTCEYPKPETGWEWLWVECGAVYWYNHYGACPDSLPFYVLVTTGKIKVVATDTTYEGLFLNIHQFGWRAAARQFFCYHKTLTEGELSGQCQGVSRTFTAADLIASSECPDPVSETYACDESGIEATVTEGG